LSENHLTLDLQKVCVVLVLTALSTLAMTTALWAAQVVPQQEEPVIVELDAHPPVVTAGEPLTLTVRLSNRSSVTTTAGTLEIQPSASLMPPLSSLVENQAISPGRPITHSLVIRFSEQISGTVWVTATFSTGEASYSDTITVPVSSSFPAVSTPSVTVAESARLTEEPAASPTGAASSPTPVPMTEEDGGGAYGPFAVLGAVGLIILLIILVLWRFWVRSDAEPSAKAPQAASVEQPSEPPPPAGVTLRIGHATDVGQERVVNEDAPLVLDLTPSLPTGGPSMGLFVVADGMGGHDAGDVASRLAVEAIEQSTYERVLRGVESPAALPEAREWLTTMAQAANRAVCHRREASTSDMGTTLVMALFIGIHVTIGNAGDSRAYRLNSEGISQITTDHSLVERLVAMGQITADQARHHPQRNLIYRVVGDKEDLEVDLFERQLDDGDALLLCSDGLSSMVPDERIWEIWRTTSSPQKACDQLIEAANQAGGEDNITVIIVQLS
jgi:protein phosphatase